MGAQYEWLTDQKSHNDISDLSVFDVKFREDDLYSMNSYTGHFEKVEGRRGIYLDIPEENRYEFKAPVSSISTLYPTDLHDSASKQAQAGGSIPA